MTEVEKKKNENKISIVHSWEKKFVEGRKRVESISEMIYCNEKIQGGATQFMDITI